MFSRQISTILGLMLALPSLYIMTACQARKSIGQRSAAEARLSSITMPLPAAIKEHVGDDKINALSLTIEGNSCENDGVEATQISRSALRMTSDDKLANEKVRRGCDYELTLSLGQASDDATKLSKVYLTNDRDGKRTKIKAADTKAEQLRVTVRLMVTEAGEKDLGIKGAIPIPSQGEVDISIEPQFDDGSTSDPDLDKVVGYDWRKNITFVDMKPQSSIKNDFGSVFYREIHEYVPQKEWFSDVSLSTRAHETLHGLHAMMRNATRERDGFVYYEGGKGAYIIEPAEVYDQIRNNVQPKFAASSKSLYDLYLINQAKSWKNALYILDEWAGYVATSRTALESLKADKWDAENADPFSGLATYVYFGAALIKTLDEKDPDYLKSNKQFKAVMAMQIERSVNLLKDAEAMGKWPNSKGFPYLRMLQTDPENEALRKVVRDYFGKDWSKAKLGF
jgi:hypothetical protein